MTRLPVDDGGSRVERRSAAAARPEASGLGTGPLGRPPRTGNRRWSWVGLGLVVLVAAGLRAWRIGETGYGNPYFSAGVRSMMDNWHNFFFDAFDPSGFVSLDKPPVAFWIQVLSAKVFGFTGFGVLLPQLLEGLAAVVLLYYLVGRRFGPSAGLLAALALAVTPVSVAMDRSSGTDSCLALVLLLAAWALSSAAQSGRLRLFVLSMALVGVGFNVKMAEALGVVPAFAATYWLAAPVDRARRWRDMAVGAAVLAAVALSWPVVYDLTPAAARPFVGSSTHNSMVELAAVYNGVDRFIPRAVRAVSNAPAGGAPLGDARPAGAVVRRPGGPPGGLFGSPPVGPLRLAAPGLAAQASWLLPLAIAGILVTLGRRRLRRPLPPQQAELVLWGGWALVYAVVYSYAGGMFRAYYLLTLAAPLAALAAIGVQGLWSWYRRGGLGAWMLPGAFVLTGCWQVYVTRGVSQGGRPGARAALFGAAAGPPSGWAPWVYGVLVGGVLLGAVWLLVVRLAAGRRGAAGLSAAIACGLAITAVLVAPSAWAFDGVMSRGAFMGPAPALLSRGPVGRAEGDEHLVAFLEANRGDARFLLATTTAMQAAPLIIATGQPVMAMGGFTGRDPILTPDRLARLVQQNQLRFVMLGGAGGFGGRVGARSPQTPLIEWVRAHGRPVAPALWRPTALGRPGGVPSRPSGAGRFAPAGGPDRRVFRGPVATQLFDLDPRAGLVVPR